MNADQYLIVRLTADFKNYVYWVQGPNSNTSMQTDNGLPTEPLNSISNRTTSKSTLGTNIQNELPTLGT